MACKEVERVAWFGSLAVFFFASFILTFGVHDMYNSPDERAAAVVIGRFVKDGVLWEEEPLNKVASGALVPRSMLAVGEKVLPVGFVGLPLWYGAFGRVLSVSFTGWLTPLLAVFALAAWRRLVVRVFVSERVGALAGWLAVLLPGLLFYSARFYMHNVAFVSLLVLGLFFLVERPAARGLIRYQDLILSGICFGTALFFRTSEWAWILALGLVLLAAFPRALSWKHLAALVVTTVVFAAPFFFWNNFAFGSPFETGYTIGASVKPTDAVSSPVLEISQKSREALFPFGIFPLRALQNAFTYQGEMIWWFAVLALFGIPALFSTKQGRLIALLSFLAAAYLILFYGSWTIADTPDPSAETLANSYVRYWLPISLAMTIPAALFLDGLLARVRPTLGRRLLAATLVILVGFFSVRLVYLHPDDGLIETRRVLLENVEVRAEIISRTEADSVIVVDRADKVLFPRRRVMGPLRSDETLATLPILAGKGIPLYYFGLSLPKEDLSYLNTSRLAPIRFHATVQFAMADQTLYKLEPL